MTDLIDTYIDVHGSKPAAVDDLTERFLVPRTRAGEWLNRRRPTPGKVQHYMRQCILEWSILTEGGDPPPDRKIDRLAARLSVAEDVAD